MLSAYLSTCVVLFSHLIAHGTNQRAFLCVQMLASRNKPYKFEVAVSNNGCIAKLRNIMEGHTYSHTKSQLWTIYSTIASLMLSYMLGRKTLETQMKL